MKNNFKALKILFYLLTFFAILFLIYSVYNKFKTQENLYKINSLEIPKKIHFAGEKVPLSEKDIRKRLDKELLVNTYWQSNMLLLIKRSNEYFSIIEPILKEENIPDDFKYLAVIESGLENVTSPAGARGFWQIMPLTAKEYGLEVNRNVDERYHLEYSTRVACKYLKKAKKKLGSWTLAAAAYNRGVRGITNKIKQQKVDTYYDLYLGSETKRYIFRILAVKEIIKNPEKYGFDLKEKHFYSPVNLDNKIVVDTAIKNIALFAKEMGINYKILKIHNPWLLENHLNNRSKKRYEISLPKSVKINK